MRLKKKKTKRGGGILKHAILTDTGEKRDKTRQSGNFLQET